MNTIAIFIFINSATILILYVLMFSLFYQLDSLTHQYNQLERNKGVSEGKMRNLISDINYNDHYLKKYIDTINNNAYEHINNK